MHTNTHVRTHARAHAHTHMDTQIAADPQTLENEPHIRNDECRMCVCVKDKVADAVDKTCMSSLRLYCSISSIAIHLAPNAF